MAGTAKITSTGASCMARMAGWGGRNAGAMAIFAPIIRGMMFVTV